MTPPAQATRRRSRGVAVLAVPLLAVLVLAGVGAAASLRAGARAERVRGLVPFAGALTTLVDELQRERSLSAARPVPGPALETARDAVDRAAAAYRDAAVRVEVSDRDRELHRRLTGGLAQLAGLATLRAKVDDAGGNDPAASGTVFRSYTRVIGGLLGVGTEIGLQEAGQDAGLLRAVSATSSFSRAKELADLERAAAAGAADGTGGIDAAERVRLATLGGRQDAVLDQFAAMATPEQLAWYSRAFPDIEVERAVALRRAALEGGSGPGPGADLAGWSGSATARFEHMREVERGLIAEVAHQATLADQAADRRTLAYAVAFFLAASTLVVLVLARGRSRRSRAPSYDPAPNPVHNPAPDPAPSYDPAHAPADDRAPALAWDPAVPNTQPPLPGPPVGERSPSPGRRGSVVHSPSAMAKGGAPAAAALPAATGGAGAQAFPAAATGGAGFQALPGTARGAGPGLADLARRSQELVDQQLELLDRVGRDQADPRLPGRLLQVDRLAVRARRNAHNLIVLAGGEPIRRWEGLAPLGEVAAVAVQDNPDAPRVDLAVPDGLLVPGAAADDLANLLAELVDNATAFSAPETRVRMGGQEVGSGYVLEVEDQGLGMTDGELEAVNRRLAGDPAAGGDPEQGLGAWVAGRLAERHGVRVQLRRSPYGGVTALVFLPERLVVAAEEHGPDAAGGPEPLEVPPAGDQPEDAALVARTPTRRYVPQVPGASQQLPKRAPHASLAPDLAAAGQPGQPGDPGNRPARSPEAVRSMLTRYRSGLERGRAAASRDLPDDPDDDPSA
jgi:signal transduction histidine kinase